MIALEEIHAGNAIKEDDINKIGEILLESLTIKKIDNNPSSVSSKEDTIDFIAEYLKKTLSVDSGLSKMSKLNAIDVLDKLKTQKEHLEVIKLNISSADIEKASERLSRKSQSAFEI